MRFVFVIPFRNCKGYLSKTADSLVAQSRTDWIAFFRDDCSDDGGRMEIPAHPQIVVQRNEERSGGLMNLHRGIVDNGLRPDDVVCVMDGDDYLTRPDALEVVARLYESRDCLLTYGQYETKDTTRGHCQAYSREQFNNLRGFGFVASHLKTFRYSLYLEAMRQDPNCERYRDESGRFMEMAWDVALMTPLLEIAGFERVAFNPEVVYHYRLHPANECSIDASRQVQFARKALSKPPMVRWEP